MSRWKSPVESETRVTPDKGLCLLIHGDAAFAGEGIIQETLNLSQLRAYSVGGTVHVIVNNQIGFTTSPSESRSTPYATDVAKMLQIPIFHVNGEDPEAVTAVVRLALEFRQVWKRDVVIDMYGYRKLGHNETDEPAFTQPKLYRAIKARKPVREAYLDELLKMGEVTQQEADAIAEHRREMLEKELTEARADGHYVPSHLRRIAANYYGGPEKEDVPVTAVPKERLQTLLESLTRLPEGFNAHPKIVRHLEMISKMAKGEVPLNWGAAEALAFATLATEGVPVRLTGQDAERGTFSHRHAVLHDVETDDTYRAFDHLAEGQAPVEIYNSPLSETAVLGFEYGYSLDCLSGLTMWEAQFGDFWNVAQPIVDQFIVSAEDKWNHLSGIVMLLPHGYEGMGPEHSSARLERFMSLAAEENIQIVYPTTPAQYFHLLRRQVLRPWRKPLVVMSPKSLLRHLECVSTLDELSEGSFQRVIPDQLERPASEVTRVLICSGKIYYELDAKRAALKRDDVAIIRYEQLYPYKPEELAAAMKGYRDGTPVFWVQEEPMNMGAWRHMRVFYGHKMFDRFPFTHVTRPPSASPATGSASSHKKEQELILNEAFGTN
jgi:2-oxoglutarate dehydrogenase E1 component